LTGATAPTTAIAPVGDQGERDIDVGQRFSCCVGHFDSDLVSCSVSNGGANHSAVVGVSHALARVIDHGVDLGQLCQPESALVYEHGS
jgi:hypothetical protein